MAGHRVLVALAVNQGDFMKGKWDDPAVPKAGWSCIEVYDSIEDDDDGDRELHRICGMCEVKPIRYIHVMTHDAWPSSIDAGCNCAGQMEGNKEAAMQREQAAKRKDRFPGHKNWRRTPDGNARLNIEGFKLTVYQKQDSTWRVVVSDRDEYEKPIWGQKIYATEYEARKAAFVALVYAKEKRKMLTSNS